MCKLLYIWFLDTRVNNGAWCAIQQHGRFSFKQVTTMQHLTYEKMIQAIPYNIWTLILYIAFIAKHDLILDNILHLSNG